MVRPLAQRRKWLISAALARFHLKKQWVKAVSSFNRTPGAFAGRGGYGRSRADCSAAPFKKDPRGQTRLSRNDGTESDATLRTHARRSGRIGASACTGSCGRKR